MLWNTLQIPFCTHQNLYFKELTILLTLILIFLILGKMTLNWRNYALVLILMRSWICETMSWTMFTEQLNSLGSRLNIKRKWIFCQIGNGDMSDHYVASHAVPPDGMGTWGVETVPSNFWQKSEFSFNMKGHILSTA